MQKGKVHFIGIGGIGISALARYYKSIGYSVTGSDQTESELINSLREEGIVINIGENEANLPDDVNKIIYTIAIKEDNRELVKAKKISEEKAGEDKTGQEKIKILTYPQALGEMTNNKKVIAVCGTHGKTTTTAMTFYALREAGLDPSMIVGSLIDYEGSKTNYVHGSEEWIVIEACEYKESFLNYNPDIILVTNVDADHLDFYKDLNHIKSSFQKFVEKIKDNGSLIIHQAENFLNLNNEQINKGIKKCITEDSVNFQDIELSVPGEHNRKNASLVITLSKALNLDENKIRQGLKNFISTWRRQEYKGKIKENIFYDDYAHHPTEIVATINAFKEKYPHNKIITCFMPHLFSRTKLLFNDFVEALNLADEIILMPIYKAREEDDGSVNSVMLADAINQQFVNKENKKKAIVVDDFLELKNKIEEKINENGDIIFITIGAGNIDKIYDLINLEK